MIQNFDMQLAKNNVLMMTIIFLVQHVLDSQVHLTKPQLFNEPWMKTTLGLLLGYALHGLLTNKLSLMVKQNLNNPNPAINNAIDDIVKFGTVFIVGEFVTSQLLGKSPDFGPKWQMASGLRIASYCAFDFIESSLPKIGSMQSLYNLLIKYGSAELVTYYVMESKLSTNNLYSTMSLLVGFAVYELRGKKLLSSMDSNSLTSMVPSITA